MDISATLRTVPLLEGMSDHHLHRLAASAVVQHYASSTTLFQENMSHHTFYLVVEGTVALDIHIPRRGLKRVLSVGPGEILAWSALLGNGVMTTSAVTIVPATLIAWPAEKFLALCQADHEIGFLMMQRIAQALSRRLTATRLQLLDMYAENEPVVQVH